MHEGSTEAELKSIITMAEASNIQMRLAIARTDQISGAAKLRLLAMEIQDAERE